MSTRVYVHLGLPKTGTTYLQSALWNGREQLAEQGCLVPGELRVSSWRAASDLLGRRPKGADARHVSGAWDAVARQVREWTGDRAVFSEELLVTASTRQVQQLASSLRDVEIHAVVTVRDLARVLPSLWQQEVRKGRTWTWPEFLSSVRDPHGGSVTAAAAFWMRFDLALARRRTSSQAPPGARRGVAGRGRQPGQCGSCWSVARGGRERSGGSRSGAAARTVPRVRA